MSKFKVGDMARNVSDRDRSLTIGKEYTVTGVDRAGKIEFLDDEGDHRTRLPEGFEPFPALPVRTRTVTEIVPGTYGRILINDPGDGLAFIRMHMDDNGHNYTAAELRAAARVFVSLAEALEWDK